MESGSFAIVMSMMCRTGYLPNHGGSKNFDKTHVHVSGTGWAPIARSIQGLLMRFVTKAASPACHLSEHDHHKPGNRAC